MLFSELSFPVSKKPANCWVKYTIVLVKAPRVLTLEKQKAVAKRKRDPSSTP